MRRLLQEGGLAIPKEAIVRGLAEVRWPARVECLARNPTVILDCAHNVPSAAALVQTLQESFPVTGRKTVVFAVSSDKQFPEMLQVLAGYFRSLDRLAGASADALQEVPDVGPVMAETIMQFFREPATRRLLERLAAAGVKMTEPAPTRGAQPFAGKTFLFTGELLGMSRGEAEALVRERGGRACSSVSKTTTYVVAGEAPGAKLKRAKALEVTILDESKFRRLLNG